MEYTKPLFTCNISSAVGSDLELTDTPDNPQASRAKLQFDAHETIVSVHSETPNQTTYSYIPFHSVRLFTYVPMEGARVITGDPYGCEKATRLIISGIDNDTLAFADNSDIKTFEEFAAFMLEHAGEEVISRTVLALTTPDIPGTAWGDGSAGGSTVTWVDLNGAADTLVIDPAGQRIYFEGSN